MLLLARMSRVGRAESFQRPGAGFCRFDVARAGRGVGHQGVEQFLRSLRHLLHRPVESRLVYLGGPRKSAQLANELQGGCPDFLVGRRRPEVVERFYVTAHANPLAFRTIQVERQLGWLFAHHIAWEGRESWPPSSALTRRNNKDSLPDGRHSSVYQIEAVCDEPARRGGRRGCGIDG
jgi:hypothetical protein